MKIFGKSDVKQVAQKPVTAAPHPLLQELARLFFFGAAAALLLSLLSYSPTDPSWSTWSSRSVFQNWIGRSGSIVADLLLQLLGLGSFALCGLLAAKVVRKSQAQSPIPHPIGHRWFPPVLFLLSFSTLLQCFISKTWMPWDLQNPGGVIGKLVGSGLVYSMGRTGAWLTSCLAFAASLVLLFRWKVVSATESVFQALIAQIRTGFPVVREWLVAHFKSVKEASTPKKAKEIPIQGATAPAPSKSTFLIPSVKPSTPTEVVTENGGAGKATLPDPKERSEDDEELFRMIAPKSQRSQKEKEVKPIPTRPSNGEYQLPPLTLLSGKAESKTKAIDRNWYLEKGNILVEKLKDFGVEGEVVNISPGPVITVYEFKPASGVKIKEISNLSDDLTLALSVLSVRIVAPIPGKPVVGIEIPSPYREMVFFKDMIEETPFYSSDIRIPIVLGRLASGEPVVAGLATMPHLLVAGSTGTGKSVFINTLICSLLYRYTPQQLKLILVDPKMVELSTYEGIPHLMLPVVVDSKKAAMALRWVVDEMERRYSLMHQYGVRHLDAYNEKLPDINQKSEENGDEPQKFLPYIVVVIDEYADLMAVVPKDVELSIARLAQKARASGIHLVLATQRPSTDVVTGTIKANFPSRISFRVASSVDSKTILDRTGADRLLGNGDMLFHSAGFSTLKRLQGAFMSDADLDRVIEHLKAQGEPEYDERILAAQEAGEDEDSDSPSANQDEAGQLYDQAVRLVTDKGEASISLIQRHLRIGYNRAATLMEQMEKEGVVAPASGSVKRRQVLVNSL